MGYAEGAVAVFRCFNHDPERHDVGKLFEADIIMLHFIPDRIRRLFPAFDGRLDAFIGQGLFQFGDNLGDQVAALLTQEFEALENGFSGVGVELSKGQILELAFHPLHADALGQGCINIHGFPGDAPALFGIIDIVEGSHVMKAVSQLDQQDADVLGHGEDELAEVFGLLGLVGLEFDSRQLGHAVDQAGDFLAEVFPDFLK